MTEHGRAINDPETNVMQELDALADGLDLAVRELRRLTAELQEEGDAGPSS